MWYSDGPARTAGDRRRAEAAAKAAAVDAARVPAKDVKAIVSELAPVLRRAVAGDEAAWRKWFETLCRELSIRWRYTASRDQWFSRASQRFVSVPPPIDFETAVICAHEIGHVLLGPCPKTGDHFPQRRGRVVSCVECERRAHLKGRELLPPLDGAGYRRMRTALGSYVRATPAPHAAREAARRQLGDIRALSEELARQRFEDKLATIQRWKRESTRTR